MTQKRALITGYDGFTGAYLARELTNAGYFTSGIVHSGANERPFVHSCDMANKANLTKIIAEVNPNVIVHLAAISFVAHGDIDNIYRVNLLGALNLLSAIADAGIAPSKVLLTSSANVYGNATVEPIDETVPVSPANDYAVSKVAMEYMARLWFDKFPIIITRPFNYTGPGQAPHFLLPKIVAHFVNREADIELGNVDVSRDFSDVRMVVAAYRKLLETDCHSEIINVCSGIGYTLQNVLDIMAGIAGYRIRIKVNPAFVRANEVKRLVGSREKLTRIIGNIPHYPLEDTLRWMYESSTSGS